MLRWTGLIFVLVFGLAACPKDNPGWTLGESGSEASGDLTEPTSSTTTTTTTSSSTTTSTTDETTEASSSTTGFTPECPTDKYCPYYTDVAEGTDPAECPDGTVEKFTAFLDKGNVKFYVCPDGNTCDVLSCIELKLTLPPEYGLIVGSLTDCSYIEHEKTYADGKCLTRSLSVWSAADDPATAAPRMIIAAHRPSAPPALSDLKVVAGGEATCACSNPSGCSQPYVLPADTWCCDGEVTVSGFTIHNESGTRFDAEYTVPIVGYTDVTYRGCPYYFFIQQAHTDYGPGCAGEPSFAPGWFMQRHGC
ncbi:MAG: hypothetical protein R3B09_24295 [Nannocystaceae bacterium]